LDRMRRYGATTQVVSPAPAMQLTLQGIEFAAVLWSEGLSRHFDNRRQVGAYAGLPPTWQSGSVDLAQGVSEIRQYETERR